MEKQKAIAMVWIEHFQRPIFSKREIRRGRKKGWLEVSYLKKANKYKKIIIHPTDIIKELS